jgi:hypothetical protein
VTRYLVAAASRETVAATCEYLDRKLDRADVGDEPRATARSSTNLEPTTLRPTSRRPTRPRRMTTRCTC